MSLNWKEIDLILSELPLAGSHIQRVSQPNFSSLVLSLYRPGDGFDLYISLENGKTRLHRLSKKTQSPPKLQRFAQLLRSRCKGARIAEAYQVHGERIVKISTAAAGQVTVIWIRLWGGAANIIATDERGRILDAFFRRPARGEVSGGSFDPEAPGKPASGPRREYAVRELPGEGDFNSRVESFYRANLPSTDIDTLRSQALAAIDRRESKELSALEGFKKKRKGLSGALRFKELGDLLMSNLHRVPEGERWVRVESFYDENESIEIELDPTISPERNAEAYYAKYKKMKSGYEKITAEIGEIESSLERLHIQRRRAEESDDPRELRRLFGEPRTQDRAAERKAVPGLRFTSGAYRILVGRSAKENDELLRRHVKGNDLWLHTRDYAGAYVFIKNLPGKSVPLEVLLDAGNLALHYSKARSGGQAELYYTHVKYLRRPKEGKRGLVLPTQEKNLLIRLEPKRLDRLFRDRESGKMGL